jgi:hypothetical protein
MFPKTDNTIADYGAAIEIPEIAQDDLIKLIMKAN